MYNLNIGYYHIKIKVNNFDKWLMPLNDEVWWPSVGQFKSKSWTAHAISPEPFYILGLLLIHY